MLHPSDRPELKARAKEILHGAAPGIYLVSLVFLAMNAAANTVLELRTVEEMVNADSLEQMLEIYQQMYHDLTSPKETRYAERREFMNWVRDCIDATQCGQDLPDFEKLWKIFN